MSQPHSAPNPTLDELAQKDTGARVTGPSTTKLIAAIAMSWSLFQLWYASPLPFSLGVGIFTHGEARAIHLTFAIFLAFLAWPAWRGARNGVPVYDWILAAIAAFSSLYLIIFYQELVNRPGLPTQTDVVVAVAGMVLLLEATRRAVGWPMALLAALFITYCMAGPFMPEVLAHRGASINRLVSHMWLTSEGVFGIALGVSTGAIFVFVLFGSLLDRAGGGNYMMQVSFAALGHMRGGPAKVAVVSSGLNGMISGSSVSNVVSTGIFTIPLMKKAGYGGVKAGAIETMSSVNGQLMPPVMGAAAFLMVEYVGIPYAEIVKHAFLPAALAYLGLVYIVHLEALKLGLNPIIQRAPSTVRDRALRLGMALSGTIVVIGVLYFVFSIISRALGEAAIWATAVVMLGLYLGALKVAADQPDLPKDIDINNPQPLQTWTAVRGGLQFLLPIGTLIWCLMIEKYSPALSAYWAIMVLMVIMLTQRPITAWLRGQPMGAPLKEGVRDIFGALETGARNMIGIGLATATAGIIVGSITLTGLGLRMTDFVEFVSGGNVLVMLLFVAFVCLILGLGVPTTANYVLVATLMAPVVVELGARADLVIPLIAVHLFVFYYGIMGDITPPVGLATFAASAISGENSIKTGVQGAQYAIRTVVLPFIWIFNPALLLIDVGGWLEVLIIVFACTVAMLGFCALTMGWFRVRLKWHETAIMALGIFVLFKPNLIMDRFADEYTLAPASELHQLAERLPDNARLVMIVQGMTLEGEDFRKTVAVRLGDADGKTGQQRVAETGLMLMGMGESMMVSSVRFGSQASRSGITQGSDIVQVKVPTDRPSANWFYIPGLLLILLVWWMQGRRIRREPSRGLAAA